jgi:hypothetical protein
MTYQCAAPSGLPALGYAPSVRIASEASAGNLKPREKSPEAGLRRTVLTNIR